jgi:hypothetical protein
LGYKFIDILLCELFFGDETPPSIFGRILNLNSHSIGTEADAHITQPGITARVYAMTIQVYFMNPDLFMRVGQPHCLSSSEEAHGNDISPIQIE